MPNPVVPLPQETLETVIGFLYDDRPALLSCSLASPRLVSACRHHLFSEVLVHPSRLTSFLKLLGAPWCSFSPSVSRLVVSGTGVRHVEPQNTNTRPPPCAANNSRSLFGSPLTPVYSPHPILRLQGFLASLNSSVIDSDACTTVEFERVRTRLRSLTSVRFASLSTSDVPETFWRAIGGVVGIMTVVADRVTLHSPSSFLEHLSSLPRLHSLSVSGVSASHISAGDPATTGHSVSKIEGTFHLPLLDLRRTHNLSLFFANQGTSRDGRASIAFLEWLLAQHTIPKAHIFKFNVDCEPEMVDPLTRYMGTVGSSVQEAWLVIPNSVTALQNMASIDFTPLTQIEVLHLEGLLITHQNSPQPLEAFFQKLFAELCSSPTDHSETCRPSLQRMSISLTVDTKHGAHSFFGIPDYVLLQPFTWFGLPSIIEEAFSSVAASLISSSSSSSWNPSPLLPTSSSLDLLKDLQVELKLKAPSIAASQRSLSEEYVREGVWKGFEERGKLQVVFVDGDSDRGRGSL